MQYEFQSTHLNVRRLIISDQDSYYELVSNKRVMKYIKNPLNESESLAELRKFITYYDQKDIFFHIWAVVDISIDCFIGICGVYENKKGEHEIAYRLHENYWGKGLGHQLAASLITHCMKNLQLKEIVAYVHQQNKTSNKILSRLMRAGTFEKNEIRYSLNAGQLPLD